MQNARLRPGEAGPLSAIRAIPFARRDPPGVTGFVRGAVVPPLTLVARSLLLDMKSGRGIASAASFLSQPGADTPGRSRARYPDSVPWGKHEVSAWRAVT